MAAEGVTFCGQVVSASQLRLICESVTRYPDLSREELANTICEWLDWYRPNGRLKARECRDLLQQLHEYSIIELPALRAGRPRGSFHVCCENSLRRGRRTIAVRTQSGSA
jgi:hypothetical protein